MEEFLILAQDGVFGIGDNVAKIVAEERIGIGNHREAADKFRDESEATQILGSDLTKRIGRGGVGIGGRGSVESDLLVGGSDAGTDYMVEAVKCAHGDEQNIGSIDFDQRLLGMLATALGHDPYPATLDDLEEALLDTFARDVASDIDGGILGGELVNLVEADDSQFGHRDIVVASLEQAGNAVFDIVAHIAGSSELGAVLDVVRHTQHVGNSLDKVGLARTGATQQQDVGLFDDDVRERIADSRRIHVRIESTIMVVDSHGETLLGFVLTDDMVVEIIHDLLW